MDKRLTKKGFLSLLRRRTALPLVALLCLFLNYSCTNDDIPSDSYYTFTGQTIADYLASEPRFSMYDEIIHRATQSATGASLVSLLGSYGYYTCFAPTDSAMVDYLEQFGCETIDGLYDVMPAASADSIIDLVAKMHVISSSYNATVYETQYFDQKLADANLYDKIIYVTNLGDTYRLNDQATVVLRDVELHNGVLHGLDHVLTPSDMKFEDFFEQHPKFSIFGRLCELTEVANRINTVPEDYGYVPDNTDYSEFQEHDLHIEAPQALKFFYTVFLESDSVYGEKLPGVRAATSWEDTLEAVKDYAMEWFLREYDDAPTVLQAGQNENWASPDNYLNRFVAYHIVNKKIARADFTRYTLAMEQGYTHAREYHETLAPNTILYVSALANGHAWPDGVDPDPNRVTLNPKGEFDKDAIWRDDKDWSRPKEDGPIVLPTTYTTENGFFHEIGDLLTFTREEFRGHRFRIDLSCISPEIQDNDFRYKYTQQGRIVFPQGYLQNVKFLTTQTVMFMICPNTNASPGGYNSHEADEMFFRRNYDFVLRLPPVPAGNYEVRVGFSSSEHRGCAQFYMGNDANCDWENENFSGMVPCGIPVDLTQIVANFGYVADSEFSSEEEIQENDKNMRNQGRMKGPNSWRGANGNDKNLRDIGTGHSPQRVILGRTTLSEDGSIYVRARSMVNNDGIELMMDYIEICPDNIFDNPEKTEPRD